MYDIGQTQKFTFKIPTNYLGVLEQITKDYIAQFFPDVYDNKIVWMDNRHGNYDIYMYNLGVDGIFATEDEGEGEFRITFNSLDQGHPKIDGDKIIWEDERNGNVDIYMCDLTLDADGNGIADYIEYPESAQMRITFDDADQCNPSIYGNRIVWSDYRNGNADIYMYDLGLDGLYGTVDDIVDIPIALSEDAEERYPAIFNDIIVWDSREILEGGSTCLDIYMHNLSYGRTFLITPDTVHTNQVNADIHNNRIVWKDSRGDNYSIYMYDLGPDGLPYTGDEREGEFLIALDTSLQCSPVIYGDKIVWNEFDERSRLHEIYMYYFGPNGIFDPQEDIREGVSRIMPKGNQRYISIHNNEVAWGEGGEIYYFKIIDDIYNDICPIAKAGEEDIATKAHSLVVLSGSQSMTPEDSGELLYGWMQISGPYVSGVPYESEINPLVGVEFSELSTVEFRPTQPGEYEFRLVVKNDYFSDSDYVIVKVKDTIPKTIIPQIKADDKIRPLIMEKSSRL